MSEQLSFFPTLAAAATSSAGSAAGSTRCGSRDGLRTGRSGRDRAPVNRFRVQVNGAARRIDGTSGRNFIVSSASIALQRSLESRLRAATDVNGSMEYVLTWKVWVTPSRRRICALRAKARRTSDNGFTGWPTPRAEDSESTGAHRGVPDTLTSASRLAGWGTPRINAGTLSETTEMPPSGAMARLELQVILAGWSTPTVQDAANNAGPSQWDRNTWPLNVQAAATGVSSMSSPVLTERRGALNPAHSRWLMGYPPEWDACAGMVTLLSRRSRRGS